MNYEVDYCFYNEDFKYLLDKTNINVMEMCEECIIISLDRGFLHAEKERQLLEIQKRWAEVFLFVAICFIIVIIGNMRVKQDSEKEKGLAPMTILGSVFITMSILFFIIVRPFIWVELNNESKIKTREIHTDKLYESHTSKEDCRLCGDNTDQLLSLYWEEKNVGIINLNTFEFSRIEINRYDDYKNLIEERINASQRSYSHFQSGESVSLQIESDRGFARSEIKLGETAELSLENLESFLCSDCLTKLMNAYFYNEEHWDIGLINFSDKTIKPFEESLEGFSSGDYYIWCDYDEEDNILKLIISFCPVRYN